VLKARRQNAVGNRLSSMGNGTVTEVFEYRTHRLVMGLIALSLPLIVSALSSEKLASISASYHSEARDWLVGLLFVVGAFLLSYNGHTPRQSAISKIAAFAAAGIAIFPTACRTCATTPTTVLHFVCATVLFSSLAYFCLGPFREKLLGSGGKKRLRRRIYLACGLTMIACMVTIAAANLLLPAPAVAALRIVYWGEAIALFAFGIAWFVSGKALGLLADEEEQLRLWGR
jgi:hypothetical protein